MNTVTIDLDEYNRLRERDKLLEQMENKEIVIHESVWRGYIIHSFGKEEGISKISKLLGDAEFKLQMTKERLAKYEPVEQKKRWFQF